MVDFDADRLPRSGISRANSHFFGGNALPCSAWASLRILLVRAPDRNADNRDATLRVLTVGRLHPAKGHDDLLRTVARLIAEGRKVTLRVLGDGPQRHDPEISCEGIGHRGRSEV